MIPRFVHHLENMAESLKCNGVRIDGVLSSGSWARALVDVCGSEKGMIARLRVRLLYRYTVIAYCTLHNRQPQKVSFR
jgi:hypothetical protein